MSRFAGAILIAAMLGVLAIPGMPAAAQPQSPEHLSRWTATVGSQVDSYLAGLSKKAKFSGVVAVFKHGTILVSRGYGMADRAHRAMNRPDTLYPGIGGSMGYSILAVVQLIERGKVKEGNGICTYISGCPAMWRHLTVRSVLTGRAGLPDIDWESSTGGVQQAFATCKAPSLGLPTGAQAHFANCGTYVLAAIISRMTGKPWATALRDNIWKPAGRSRTGRLTHALKPPRRAAGYSNVLDVQRYDQALFGARLVNSRWLRTMVTPQAGVEPPDSTSPMWMPAAKNLHYGYYWSIGSLFGHRLVYTAGSAGSSRGANLHFPNDGVDIVVASNDDTNQIGRIAQEVVRLTLNG